MIITLTTAGVPPLLVQLLQRLFDELDVDGSGTLSAQELESALCRAELGGVTREEVHEMIQRADANGDGVVDFTEFVEAWRRSSSGGAAAATASALLRRGLVAEADDMELDE